MRARMGAGARVRGCHRLAPLGRTTPPTEAHAPRRHPGLSLPRSHATPRAPAPPPLLPELREKPVRQARARAGAGDAREGRAGAGAPIHLRTSARRARGRARGRAGEPALSPARAARAPGEGAAPWPPCQSPRRLAAPGRSRPPRSLLPNCYPECVTVRSNDIRILKQLVIRGVISCN